MIERSNDAPSYNDALAWLYGLKPHGIQLGLDRVKEALHRLGDPQQAYRVVTIAGTNGKGSTAKFLASILHTAGYRTGLTTSPHLTDIRERVCVGNLMIPPNVLARLLLHLRDIINTSPAVRLTFFEALTVVALAYFRERDVEVGILEVGLGGRLDATAAATPDVAIITGIGLDHQDYLGDTLEEICREKAGIIKPGATVVTNVDEELFRKVVGPIAFEQRCPIRRLGVDFVYQWLDDLGFRYRGWINRLGPVRLGLAGTYQGDNAALACAAAESLAATGFHFNPIDVAEGLLRARHPGRLERREPQGSHDGQQWPALLLDGAHNEPAASNLAQHLEQHLPERPRVMVFGAKEGKNHLDMLRNLGPMVDCIVLTEASNGHEFTPGCISDVRHMLPDVIVEPDLERALLVARKIAAYSGSILITGSLYLVGDAMQYLPRPMNQTGD